MIKKLFTLFTLILLAIPLAWGTDVTFIAGTDTGEKSVTKDNVTVSMSTMSRADNYRCYANSSMTITCDGYYITKIVITCTGSNNAENGPGKFSLSSGGGNYSYSDQTQYYEKQ